MMQRAIISALFLSFLIIPAVAQGPTTGTLTGTVVDEDDKPVAGAVVRVVGELVTREVETDAEGKWRIRGMAPGTYSVVWEIPDHARVSMDRIRVSAGGTTEVPFRASDPDVKPVVTSVAAWTGVENRVDDLVPYIPLGRNVSSLYGLGPVADGDYPEYGLLNRSISGGFELGNQAFLDGVSVVEPALGGVGTYSEWRGSFGSGLTTDFFESVQVGTGGFGAEYGRLGGGMVNATLRSGTKEPTFDLAWFEEPSSLQGDPELILNSPNTANRLESSRRELFLSGSGSLLDERLFVFAAFNPVMLEEEFTLTSGNETAVYDLDGDGVYDDSFPVGDSIVGGLVPETVTRKRSRNNYALKLTGFVSSDHRVELSVFGDPSDGDNGPQDPEWFLRSLTYPYLFEASPDAGAREYSWGGSHLALRHQGSWTPNLFTEFSYARKSGEFREIAPDLAFRCFFYDPATDCLWRGDGPFQDVEDRQDQWSLKAVHILGPVELTYGAQYYDIQWRDARYYRGREYTATVPRLVDFVDIDIDGDGVPDFPGTGLLGDGSPESSYVQVPASTDAVVDLAWCDTDGDGFNDFCYAVTESRLGPQDGFTGSEETALFVQATWEILPNLTLQGGLRRFEQKLSGTGSFTTPVSSLSGSTLTSVASTTYTATDYEFDAEIAPRLGITWDPLSDGRHRLYAFFGRYFNRAGNDLARRLFSPDISLYGETFVDPSLSTPLMDDTCWTDANGDGVYETEVACHLAGDMTYWVPGTVLDGTVDPLGDPDSGPNASTKLPYTDEWLAGYAWQANEFLAAEFRYIHRSLGRVVEDVQFASSEQVWNQFYGGLTFGGAVFPGHGESSFGQYVLANPGDNVSSILFSEPVRDYDALEVIVRFGPYSGWTGRIDYRYSVLEGNFDSRCCGSSAITELYDIPAASAVDNNGDGNPDLFLASGTAAGIYSEGPLPNDRRHVLNAYVSRSFDFGLNAGARLSYRSGRPRAPYLSHPLYRSSGIVQGSDAEYWWLVRADVDGDGLEDGFGIFVDSDPTRGSFPDQDYDGDGIIDTALGSAVGPNLYGYTAVARDSLGRTDAIWSLDLHASYDLKVRGDRSRITFMLDIFNVLDQTDVLETDDLVEIRTGLLNSDFGRPTFYQPPRTVRLGAKFTW